MKFKENYKQKFLLKSLDQIRMQQIKHHVEGLYLTYPILIQPDHAP